MSSSPITSVDSGIIIGYFIIVLIIGYVLARKRYQTTSDYFLAGNKLGWAAIGFSLFASNISSASIIGLSGQAYSTGISIANYEWMATLVLVFMAVFIVPIYLRNKIATVPEYLELRYDAFSRKYYSAVTIILTLIVDIASSLYAGALVIRVFYPDISVIQACYAIALISGLYTAWGGLAAVVYTDILQSVVLLIGGSIMLFAVLSQYDYSWANALSHIPEPDLSFMRPLQDRNLPWLGTLIGVPVLGFYYWSTNQYVVQRILGAKDVANARWGAFLGGFLKLLILFLIVFPGIMSLHLFPDVQNHDEVYPTMVRQLIPPGVIGLVLAGLIAAIMSSVDSALNASSTLIVLDFLKPRLPHLDQKQLTRYGRLTTLLLMVVAGIWAPIIQQFQGLFNYLQEVLSYTVPPVATIFIFGFFWRKGTAAAARYTLIFGHLLCLFALVADSMDWLSIHYTITAGLLTLICNFLYIFLSYRSQPRPALHLRNLTWRFLSEDDQSQYPWFIRTSFLALCLTAITFIILITYW